MAKKSIEGQMDMFELFGSVEELEENVKGVPEPLEEPESSEEAEGQKVPEPLAEPGRQIGKMSGTPVMQRCFCNKEHMGTAVVAYLDYNKVYLKDWEGAPVIYQFGQSKDAVDFYVEQMERFSGDEQTVVQETREALEEAPVIRWAKESWE